MFGHIGHNHSHTSYKKIEKRSIVANIIIIWLRYIDFIEYICNIRID